MDATGQSCREDARRPASKRQASVPSGTGQPGLIDGPLPPFQRAHIDAWLKLMRREDVDVLAEAVRTEQNRHGQGSACAAANDSTLPVCVMRQQTPARVHLSNFPPEILSLIFSHVDTATLLDAVPHVCRNWRTACSDDVYGPKVRLELRSVQRQLRIRHECLGIWVAAFVGRFAWVVDMDLRRCDIEDGVLECAGSLQRITSLDISGDGDCPSKITDTGLEHIAQRTHLTSLNLDSHVWVPGNPQPQKSPVTRATLPQRLRRSPFCVW